MKIFLFSLILLFITCEKTIIKKVNSSYCIKYCAQSFWGGIDGEDYPACKDFWKDKKCCTNSIGYFECKKE